VWRSGAVVDLTMTVGMEEHQMGSLVMQVVAIPVVPCARLLTLNYLSADRT
jgi:hypothetical protein